MFENLYKPLSLGPLSIPNRICFQAHRTHFSRNRRINNQHTAYYARRAQGGSGLIILGELTLHPQDMPYESMIDINHPEAIQDFQSFTGEIHKQETKVFAQLIHRGFQSSGSISRRETWAPSGMQDFAFGETSKVMEKEDMEQLIDSFAAAAERIREGGFDGIEIDMGPESILRQFLSTISNHRSDDYGGDLENRMRFPLQIVEAVRNRVGKDFCVGVRICGDEKFWGGITTDESVPFAKRLEFDRFIDFINVTVGTFYNLNFQMPSMHIPSGFTIDTATSIADAVDIPVMAGHQIDFPYMAEETLAKSAVQGICLIRTLICDPDAPIKGREGRFEEIRHCIRDNEECIGRLNRARTLGCSLNPDVGYEHLPDKTPVDSTGKKRVLVVGGGPAGMEAAIRAGELGHDVSLYEKEEKVGGRVNIAAMLPGRQRLGELTRFQENELVRLGVQVMTGTKAITGNIIESGFDAVIVASGSKASNSVIPGEYGAPFVMTVPELFGEGIEPGERILYIDENGGHHATATVEWLLEQGKKVDMVTSELFVGIDVLPLGDLTIVRQTLLQKGCHFICDVRIEEIDEKRVRGRNIYSNEQVMFKDYDTVVMDLGYDADDRLYKELTGKVKELYHAGDCVAPRGIGMAVFEGRRVGEKL